MLNGSLGVGEKLHTQTRESLGVGDKSASVCVYLVLSFVNALPASCLMHFLLSSSTSCSTQARTTPTPRFFLFKYPPHTHVLDSHLLSCIASPRHPPRACLSVRLPPPLYTIYTARRPQEDNSHAVPQHTRQPPRHDVRGGRL